MEGKYIHILRQAFYLTKGYKTFWLAGLFLVWLVFFRSFAVLYSLGDRINWGDGSSDGLPTISPISPVTGNPWIGLITLVAIFLLVIYYFRSKAILISSLKHLRTKADLNKKEIKEESEPYTTTLLKLGFGLGALGLLIVSFLISPIYYLFSNNYEGRAEFLGIISLIVFVPAFVMLYYTSIFAPMFIMVQRLSIKDSIKMSFDVIRRRWVALVSFTLLLLVIEIVMWVVSLTLMVIGVLPFVLLIQIFYDVEGSTTTNVLVGIGGTIGFVLFFMAQGLFAAFHRIAWGIAFFEMIKPIKSAQTAETVTVPEVIS